MFVGASPAQTVRCRPHDALALLGQAIFGYSAKRKLVLDSTGPDDQPSHWLLVGPEAGQRKYKVYVQHT